MAEPVRIDSHMHLYPTKSAGRRDKELYEIWEYGKKPDVAFSDFDGDLADAHTAMQGAGYQHAVIANLFSIELLEEDLRSTSPADQAKHLVAFNRWACDLAAANPRFSIMVGADPDILGGEAGAEHLRDMVVNQGAKGIKIHPVSQRFMPDDPRMHPIYRQCIELGVPVLSHSGTSHGPVQFGDPKSFARLMNTFPELTLILAHLGGGSWRQTAEFANAYPQVYFDLCEIIAWTGAPNAPTVNELALLINDIGPDRVMMGTDFPWYDLDVTANQVMALPFLSDEHKLAIMGGNAARILGLESALHHVTTS